MSDQPAPSAPASPPPAPPPAATRRPPPGPTTRPPSRRGGALAPLALVLALLALAAVAYGGWQWWQSRANRQADAAAVASLAQRVATLETGAAAARQDRADDQKARASLRADTQAVGQQLDGVSTRVSNLENAVASLARHKEQGRRAMLLDQTEMLLRMGAERYRLFHDAGGALKAFALADQTLAAVDDPAYAQVRRTLATERKALDATHPATREADLAALARLRSRIAQLPLRPLDADAAKSATPGFWQRVWHALSTAVVVRHIGAAPTTLADARLTRQLAALDVAQAEASRAAWDGKAFHAALERVDQALATTFDVRDADVRKARAEVARMLAEPVAGSAPVDVGEALTELRDMRAVQGLQEATPAPSATAPAPSTSVSGPPA